MSMLLGLSNLWLAVRDGLFWRVPYHCGRIIGHFTVQIMVGYNFSGSSTVAVDVFCEFVRNGREGPCPMAWHFPV